MANNKVIIGEEVIIDLTQDTVTAENLVEGITAHDSEGNEIIGTRPAESTLEALTDVNIEDVADGQILRYDEESSEWKNASLDVADEDNNGLMSAEDKAKLDTVEENANNYVLPTASDSVKGGIKIGANLTMDGEVLNATDTKYTDATTTESGLMSSADKTKLNGIDENANNYTLPVASATTLGGIKVGENLTIENGVLNAVGGGISTDVDPKSIVSVENVVEVTNSADGNIVSLHMFGSGHKSKNLLNSKITQDFNSGVTLTENSDGSITVSGTPSRKGNICWFTPMYLPQGTYMMTDGGASTQFEADCYMFADLSSIGQGYPSDRTTGYATLNITQDGTYRIGLYCNSDNITAVNGTFYPMVVPSSEAGATYEPYGLIIADKIESQNKNLFYDRLDNYAVYGDSTYGYKVDILTNAISYVAKIEPNKIYTISKKLGVGNRFRCATFPNENFISQNSIDGAIEITATGYTSNEKTFTNGSNKYLVLTVTTEKITEEPMAQIEVGDVATEYVECKSSVISIKDVFGSDFTLASVGDIRNELIVNADGSGKYIKRVEKVDLGTLTYAYSSTYSVFSTDMLKSTAKTGTNNIICDKYNNENSTNPVASLSDYSISFNTANTLRIKDTSYTDVSVFKTAMDGVYLVYELESPTVTKLSISEAKALLSLKTFKDYTLIKTDCEADIEYYKNNKIGQTISDVETKLENEIVQVDGKVEEVSKDVDYIYDNGFASKNLFDKNNAIIKKLYINPNESTPITSNGAFNQVVFMVKAGKTYTISFNQYTSARKGIFGFADIPETTSTVVSTLVPYGSDSWKVATVTIPNGVNYITVLALKSDTETQTIDAKLADIQIEEGASATPYQPYAKSNIELEQDIKAIPTPNNAKLTIKQGGEVKGSFTANASQDVTIELATGGGGGGGGAESWADLSGKPFNSVGSDFDTTDSLLSLASGIKTKINNIPTVTDTYSSTSSDAMSGKAVASAISGKANSSTTLSGYGITNAYTKTEIDNMIGDVETLLASL